MSERHALPAPINIGALYNISRSTKPSRKKAVAVAAQRAKAYRVRVWIEALGKQAARLLPPAAPQQQQQMVVPAVAVAAAAAAGYQP